MSKKRWHHSDADGLKVGVMVCNYCKKAITTGQFKYYQDNEGCFRGHAHRKCTPDDPKWAALDRARATEIAGWQEYLEAMHEFKKVWQTDALDEEIADYTKAIAEAEAEAAAQQV